MLRIDRGGSGTIRPTRGPILNTRLWFRANTGLKQNATGPLCAQALMIWPVLRVGPHGRVGTPLTTQKKCEKV
jgi:hypothetical protein